MEVFGVMDDDFDTFLAARSKLIGAKLNEKLNLKFDG
jgi:hypothetical protein